MSFHINSNLNYLYKDWGKILTSAREGNSSVEKMARLTMHKNFDELFYDPRQKSISYGDCTINLKSLLKPASSFPMSKVKKVDKMIQHLANLIELKLLDYEDAIRANRPASTKRPREEVESEKTSKRIKLTHQVVSNEMEIDEEEAPLFKAAFDGDIATLTQLIENGVDLNARDSAGYTVFDIIKLSRPKNFEKLKKMLKAKNPELIMQNKEFRARKLLAHATNQSGSSRLKNEKVDYSINLTGGFSAGWYHQLDKNLALFAENMPHASLLKDAIAFAADEMSHTNGEILERIKRGDPTFVANGFTSHEVTFLIWGDQFVICNRGDASTPPLEVYHYDPDRLTMDQMISIMASRNTQKDYESFLDELHSKLGFQSTELDEKLEEEGLELEAQVVGNCTWISPMTGIFAFLALSEIKEQGKLHSGSFDNAFAIYYRWDEFQKIRSLEQMIQLMGTSKYLPDHSLIQNALLNAYQEIQDPHHINALDKLEDHYLKTLSDSEQIDYISKKMDIL